MQNILLFIATIAIAWMATPIRAWWPPSPQDPHPGVPTHYQNDPTQPVQEKLVDCWLFDVQTWQQPLSHWTHIAAYHCATIAQRHTKGLPLTPSEKALEALLLAYENAARQWSIQAIAQNHIDRMSNTHDIQPDALALRSGWYALRTLKDTTAADIGLLDVLEALQ